MILFADSTDFAKHPITSRAHLLDIPLYLSSKSLPPISELSTSTPISLSTLKGCAEFHGISLLPGDILLVRTGFTEAFEAMSDKDREEYKDKDDRASCGVSPDEDVLRWHWENGIAAVGTDTWVLCRLEK
jgi:kynurenine formamidase